MDYKKIFSYCLKNDYPESKLQFHYQYDFEPTTVDFEQWLVGELYGLIQIEKVGGNIISVDYRNPAEKDKQIEDFLDYHFSKYDGSLRSFDLSLKIVVGLLKSHPDFKTDNLYYISINQSIEDWMIYKNDDRCNNLKNNYKLTKPMNFTPICNADKIEHLYDFLNNSYLSEIPDKSHFYYAFGIVGSCTDFKPLNWIKTLKDLNAFINKFYINEP